MCSKIENYLAIHCSPALFGIKPSNLINICINEVPNILEQIEQLNKIYNPEICFKILKQNSKKVLILVYRSAKLRSFIFKPYNYLYLSSFNYPKIKSLDEYLDFLKDRINNENSFPHEIGVFLGYDISDIIEYQKGNKKCLFVGYWKVFSELERKKKIFNQYEKCKNLVINLLNKGYKLDSLI